jgi:hypothetical protein
MINYTIITTSGTLAERAFVLYDNGSCPQDEIIIGTPMFLSKPCIMTPMQQIERNKMFFKVVKPMVVEDSS